MLDGIKLFLGFTPDETFQRAMSKANPYLVSLLIGKEEYLQEVVQGEKRHLGKFVAAYPTLDQLKDLETHLLSLLKKLAPSYPFDSNPPLLMTVADGN